MNALEAVSLYGVMPLFVDTKSLADLFMSDCLFVFESRLLSSAITFVFFFFIRIQ